jgi:hypothetical protein
MKNIIYFYVVFLFCIFSCDVSDNENTNLDETKIIGLNDNKIISLSISNLENSTKLNFDVPLILPDPICSNDSSIMIFDVGDNKIKQLYLNEKFSMFDPLGNGPSKLGGSIFKGVGYSIMNSNDLLLGSDTNIKGFNVLSNSFDEEVLDYFPQCINFSPAVSEIFNIKSGSDTLVISQNGEPCIVLEMAENSFSIKDFKSIKFLRIKPKNREFAELGLSIPDKNDIIVKNELFVRTELFVSYNENRKSFFAVINPTNHLYEFKLDPNNFNFELKNTWNLNLPYSEHPINYTLNNGINRELAQDNLKYNFQINLIKAFDKYLVLSYIPSKSTHFSNSSEAPYASHYLIALFNLEDEKLKVFSLDYNEIYFLGSTNNGKLWFYNIVESEKGKSTVVQVLEINDLLK